MTTSEMYIELVQSHERTWGTEQYAGRPSLSDLLHRPVVVFWSGDDKSGKNRFTVSVHNAIDELDEVLLNMVLAGKVTPSSSRRLSRLYVKQKEVKIKGLHLVLAESERGK